MSEVRRSWDMIPKEKRNEILDGIIYFFKEERDEEIGRIAAESILDYFLQNVGIDLYNKGVEDSRKFMKARLEEIELDMDSLLKK